MKITKELTDSLTLKFSQIAREKNKKGEKILSLGLGEPAFDTPQAIVDATYQAMKDGLTKYSNSAGLFELREAIKNKLLKDNGIETRIENIVVTPGAKQALMLALMAILKPNDEVINISPCYVSFIPQIKIAEPSAVVHNVDLNKEDLSINWDKIEKLINIKTKAFIINYPHNPTGQVLNENDIERLTMLARKKHCYILSDEIYEKLNFMDVPHFSPASIKDIKDKIITINGFSKAFSMTGWRIGYLEANQDIIQIVLKLQQHINTNTCTFIQKGACAAFSLDDDYLKTYNNQLKEKAQYMKEVFFSNIKLRLIPPKAGLFAFLNIRKTGYKSDDFASLLLEHKSVAATPGIAFGDNWNDHIRISLAADIDEFKEAIDRIDEFVKNL